MLSDKVSCLKFLHTVEAFFRADISHLSAEGCIIVLQNDDEMNRTFPLVAFLTLGLFSYNATGCSGDSAKKESATSKTISQDVADVGDISGPVTIIGRFKDVGPLEGKMLKLYETEGKDRFLLDSTIIENGAYRFDLDDAKIGMYRLGVSSLESAIGEIIISPNEKEITIDYRTPNFMNSMVYSGSDENKANLMLKSAKRSYDKKLSSIRKTKIAREEKLKRIFALDTSLDKMQDSLAGAYPGTFFAKMARQKQSPNRFDKNRYWDDIDFKDESMIRSTVLNDRIQDYMRNHASKENTKDDNRKGFYNGVDRIAQLVKERGSDRILEFMLYTISEGFYTSGMEDVSHYVIDNYFYGDACGDSEISELFKMKAAGIRKLQVGNNPPDFTLPSSSGGSVTMSEVASKNKYTLIMFWASFCHKCEAEIPLVNNSYRQFKSKGFEVISVSVDTNTSAWKKGISEKNPPGYNCSDVLGWAGPTTKDYRVTSTPVMFLIDKTGNLVLKPKSAGDINRFLSQNL